MRKKALYKEIAEDLIVKIESGNYKSGPFPSEKELCSEYSTSRKTIRRALEILENRRIIQTEQGKGRKVASFENGDKLSSNNILCVVSRYFVPYAEFNNEISKLFGNLGYKTQIVFQNNDYSFDYDHLSKLEYDGIVFIGINKDHLINDIINLTPGKPAIVFNHNECLLELDNIGTDMYTNSFRGCQYLIDYGHIKIGAIINSRFMESMEGIKKCFELNSINYKKNSFLIAKPGGIPENELDKFISRNDFTALYLSVYRSHGSSVFSYLQNKNIKVPDDISVMGYDDVDIELEDKIIRPDCMATQWLKLAELTVDRLSDIINNSDQNTIRYCVDSKIVKRGTVKKIIQKRNLK